MLQEGMLTDLKSESTISTIIKKIVTRRGFSQIKANAEGYDPPSAINRTQSDESYIPDITATKNNSKSYFEVARKTDDVQKVVSKWKLLSTLAEFKRGKLYLIAPYGNFAFAQRLVETYSIPAKIIKLT